MQMIFLATISMMCIPVYALENFDIVLKSKWQELCTNDNKCSALGGKWILAGSITFKKGSKEPVCVNEINLRWHGEKLNNLIASLYRKNVSKNFLAIEENLICDGIWNEKKQTLILNFNEKENLGTTTTFYLVLTIPEAMEPILKNGYFDIESAGLPKAFKQCSHHGKLSLASNNTPKKT